MYDFWCLGDVIRFGGLIFFFWKICNCRNKILVFFFVICYCKIILKSWIKNLIVKIENNEWIVKIRNMIIVNDFFVKWYICI